MPPPPMNVKCGGSGPKYVGRDYGRTRITVLTLRFKHALQYFYANTRILWLQFFFYDNERSYNKMKIKAKKHTIPCQGIQYILPSVNPFS